jgi:MFS family permease
MLGWVSLLNDMASEMLYPVIPVFITRTLGASPEVLGFIEGIAEGGGSILRWLTGAISDRFRRRKAFVVIGYFLSALAKPVIGAAKFFGGWPMILAGRVGDRVGKAIRTSPRDALIADSTDSAHRGLAFGFHRMMDSIGAIAGPLILLAILTVRPTFPKEWIFFLAVVPGLASVAVAQFFVRDQPHEPASGKAPPRLWQSYSPSFWFFILATAVFALGNSADSFLLLRSTDLGLGFRGVILAYVLFSAVFAATATQLGRLSDRIGRKPVIIAGWVVFAGVYLGFSAEGSSAQVWIWFAIYGLYQSLTDGVTKALITDVVEPDQRGGAIGIFYTITGVCQIAANLITGRLWNVWLLNHHLQAGLLTGAIAAIVAIPFLAMVRLRTASST